MAKDNDIPKWVTDEIRSVKFGKPAELVHDGYVLDVYEKDSKVDIQLYEPVEDGRHIVTMDLPKKIKPDDMERGVVYKFTFKMQKAELDKKVVEYLQKVKEVDLSTIYQFGLVSFQEVD